jgi:LuxR family maltose regulon positive regulatory protein
LPGALKLADGDFAAAVKAVGPCLAAPGAAGGTGECGTGAHDRGAHETEVNGTQAQRTGALLVAAVARRRLGDVAAAAQLTEAALALAEPEGAYRAFLDGGSCVRTAITVLVPPTSRYAGFAGRVLERFEGQGHRLAAPGGDVRLTESERAVLRFLPSHMTNQEISRALFLSVNTVKTHLRSAYRKLGAGSRREAIARARRLGLL